MKSRHKRLSFIAVGLVGLGLAGALILNSLKGNMAYFYSPSDIMAGKAPRDKNIRIGGLVQQGSLKRNDDGLTVNFYVTDTVKGITVVYTGILPDLFREGQGVVAQGKLGADGKFHADEVLAKHDEKYMPPEVAETLKKAKKSGVEEAGDPIDTEGKTEL